MLRSRLVILSLLVLLVGVPPSLAQDGPADNDPVSGQAQANEPATPRGDQADKVMAPDDGAQSQPEATSQEQAPAEAESVTTEADAAAAPTSETEQPAPDDDGKKHG